MLLFIYVIAKISSLAFSGAISSCATKTTSSTVMISPLTFSAITISFCAISSVIIAAFADSLQTSQPI